jgi:hypothetical protein
MDIKSQQFYWIHNFEPQVADLGFIHFISGLDSQFFSFFLTCTLHDSAPMYNINQTIQFLVWNWSRSTCTIRLNLPSLHIFQTHFYSGKFLKCPTISPRMFVFYARQKSEPKCITQSAIFTGFLSAWKKLLGSKQHCKFVRKQNTQDFDHQYDAAYSP